MNLAIQRRYATGIEAAAAAIPVFDTSDAIHTRIAVQKYWEQKAAQGLKRPSDDRISESHRIIPGPAGAPDLNLRLYTPKSRSTSRAAFVNFHGGGFFMGDLESEHLRCLTMTRETGAISIGVDYRLAPENRYPAAVEDCYHALCWVSENARELNIDPDRIVVGGGSAGGCLSAAVALIARDLRGPAIALQMLFYPGLDHTGATRSMADGADCYVWNMQNCRDMWGHYLSLDRHRVSPYASPTMADNLSGLPPAYIVTCEHDPLRDEGIEYALRLMQADVAVELHNYAGTVHAFDLLISCPLSQAALQESAVVFSKFLGGDD